MNKWKIMAAIAIVAMLIASATVVFLLTTNNSKPVTFEAVSDSIDIRYAKSIINNLTAMGDATGIDGKPIGFRNAGSPASIQASLYVRDEMESIGLANVTLDKIPLDSWEFRSAWVNVSGVGKIQAVSHGGSANTSSSPFASADGSITAEIVDVGNGGKNDYIGKNVSGKVVLADFNKNMWTNTLSYEAKLHGAIAAVYSSYENPNTTDSDLIYGLNETAIVAMDGEYKPSYLPVLVISGKDGLMLVNKIKNSPGPVTVSLFSDIMLKSEEQGAFGYNVVGYLPGRNWGNANDEYMIVGDHTDAWWYGASDNSAGVAAVLAIADAFKNAYDRAGTSPNRTMIFITHEAEEWGQFGTYYDWCWGAYYETVHLHPEWVGRTVGAIIPDVIGFDYKFGLEYSPELDTFVKEVVSDNDARLPYGTDYYAMSTYADQWAYAAVGIPSIGCYNWELEYQYQYYHTQLDTEDRINYTYLNGTIVTIADMAFRLTNARILPYDFSFAAETYRSAMIDSSIYKVSQLDEIYKKYGIDADANMSRAVSAVEVFVEKTKTLTQNLPLSVSFSPSDSELRNVNSKLLELSRILGTSMIAIGVWDDVGYLPYTQSLFDVKYLDYTIVTISNPSVTLNQVKLATTNLKDWVGVNWYYDYISEPNYREFYNISYGEGKVSFGTQEHLYPPIDLWDEVDRLTLMVGNNTLETSNLADIIVHLKEKMLDQAFANLEDGFRTMWAALEGANAEVDSILGST